MALWIAYVDESHDDRKFVLSALVIRHSLWRECFNIVKDHRLKLRQSHGIRLSKEIHSREFVRGKGHSVSSRSLGKWERSRVFHGLLELTVSLPSAKLFNVCLAVKGRRDPELDAWDRLFNRLESFCRVMESDERQRRADTLQRYATSIVSADFEYLKSRLLTYSPRMLVIADQGREKDIERVTRKMRVVNYIPSQYGAWSDGKKAKNITTDRIIEDVIFKQSHRSYFVQLADHAAYALLKREVPPTPVIKTYGVHRMWETTLGRIAWKAACAKDPFGIVRA